MVSAINLRCELGAAVSNTPDRIPTKNCCETIKKKKQKKKLSIPTKLKQNPKIFRPPHTAKFDDIAEKGNLGLFFCYGTAKNALFSPVNKLCGGGVVLKIIGFYFQLVWILGADKRPVGQFNILIPPKVAFWDALRLNLKS